MSFRERLQKRLPNLVQAEQDWIVHLVERYDLKPMIKSLQNGKFVFFDNQDRSAALRIVSWGKEWLYIRPDGPEANAEALSEDIQIIVVDDLLAGWVSSKDLMRASEGIWGVKYTSLSPMPEEFDFSRTCAHLAVHGGHTDGSAWICYGCGKSLVFNDSKR